MELVGRGSLVIPMGVLGTQGFGPGFRTWRLGVDKGASDPCLGVMSPRRQRKKQMLMCAHARKHARTHY